MQTKPVYYRWAYSLTTGDVTLSHNHEGHPADVEFHSDMAANRPESDLELGYAYRMDNAWKVTDADHKAVDDPYVRVAVEKAINQYEGFEQPENVQWKDDHGNESEAAQFTSQPSGVPDAGSSGL